MGMHGINAYLALMALYGREPDSSGTLPESACTKQADLCSVLGPASSSSLSDVVDFSKTAELFSRLRQLGQTDPDRYEEVVKKLGERLLGARGYAGQVIDDLVRKMAEGADIAEAIMQSPAGTSPCASAGSSAGRIRQLISEILSGLNTDD